MDHKHHNHKHFEPDLEEMYLQTLRNRIGVAGLPHRDYAPLIRMVRYMGMETPDTMRFFVPNRYNGWMNYIQLIEMPEQVRDESINAVEAARLLIWGANCRIHCTCPAYRYWGMQYIDTKLDIAIVPEERMPSIRNPHLKGIVCKHLKRTLAVVGFHNGDLAAEVKRQRQEMGIVWKKPGIAPLSV
jgi:hypothetical protein